MVFPHIQLQKQPLGSNTISTFTKKQQQQHYLTEAGGLCEIEAVLRQARRGGRSWVVDGHLRGRPASTGLAFQLKTIIFRLQLLDLHLSDHPHGDKTCNIPFST